MVAPISGGTAFDFGAAAQATAAPAQTATAPAATVKQPSKNEPAAEVRLSDSAQVHLLRTQGQTVAEIAISTDLSTQTVNSYLGITQAPPTAGNNK
jgi:hypothetical protein